MGERTVPTSIQTKQETVATSSLYARVTVAPHRDHAFYQGSSNLSLLLAVDLPSKEPNVT